MNHIDLKSAIPLVIVFAGIIGTWTTSQIQIQANADTIKKIEGQIEAQTEIESQVEKNADRLKQQAKGINWIGKAVEEIARQQEIPLPERDIVPVE